MKNQIGSSLLDKILSVVLVLIIFSAIGALTYSIAVPPVISRFTEFYVLNSNGQANNYPKNLAVGEEAKVIIGIANQEHETASYRIEMKLNGTSHNVAAPLTLNQAGTWQETITFRPAVPGNNQKVEFLLYKSGQSEVYRSVYILVNVN